MAFAMIRFSMTGGPGPLPGPPSPSGYLPSPLCLCRLALPPRGYRNGWPPPRHEKRCRPRALEDGTVDRGLWKHDARDAGVGTLGIAGSSCKIEELLRLALHVEPHILMRLV